MLADTSALRCNSKCDPYTDLSDGSGTPAAPGASAETVLVANPEA